nr:metallophosphoesterase [uncultured Celeribacter sp.]
MTAAAQTTAAAALTRLSLDRSPAVTYAVGDIHGQFDLYKALEARILRDALRYPAPRLLVLLGDVIDRGPQSAQMIDHLLRPPPKGLTRLCLRGNHEALFLRVLQDQRGIKTWRDWGGRATLSSYGIRSDQAEGPRPAALRALAATVPAAHQTFLSQLPLSLDLPAWFFSHAGATLQRSLAEQTPDDLLWGASGSLRDATAFGKWVVHGHEIVPEASFSRGVLRLDTGAYRSGRLSGVRLCPDQPPRFFAQTMTAHQLR